MPRPSPRPLPRRMIIGCPISPWAQAILAQPDAWVVVDTETTGGKQPEVIELAVIDLAGQTLINTLVQPTSPINPFARRQHGIQDAWLQDAPAWAEVHAQFGAVLAGRSILAYNAAFDAAMVAHTSARYGCTPLESSWVCVMQAIQAHLPILSSSALAHVCHLLGVPRGRHRAQADARATLNVVRVIGGESPWWWDAVRHADTSSVSDAEED